LPQPVGQINDYGQTLERTQRQAMAAQLATLQELGINLYYLASWRDPYGDPQRYAQEIFHHWGLSAQDVLLVLVRGEDGRWRAAGVRGLGVGEWLPQRAFDDLLDQAQGKLRGLHPGRVALWWVEQLVLLAQGELPQRRRALPAWAYGGLALLGGGILGWAAVRRLCPRCLRPLHRTQSWGGIIYRCPRCWYTRTPRRGRGPGSRRGFHP